MKRTDYVTPGWVRLPGRNDGKWTHGANPLIIVLDRSLKASGTQGTVQTSLFDPSLLL